MLWYLLCDRNKNILNDMNSNNIYNTKVKNTFNIKTLKGNDFDIVLIISLFLSKILLYDLVINSRTVLYFTKIETVKLSNNSAQ